MGIHTIDDSGNITEYKKTGIRKEKEIEDFVENNPSVLDKNIFIIGRQIKTDMKAKIDLMGLDNEGNTAIIEFKRGMSSRDAVSQILEYGVWAEKLGYEKLNEIAKKIIYMPTLIYTKSLKVILMTFQIHLTKINACILLLKILMIKQKLCANILTKME